MSARRSPSIARLAALAAALLLPGGQASAQQPSSAMHADMIVTGARVWTADTARPWADALATRGARIVAVGSRAEVEALAGPGTQRVHVAGAFVAPGFIDNHTHFERAGELLLGVNLLAVASDTGLVRAIRDARERMPAGAWITGGEWGAYEAWARNASGRDAGARSAAAPWSPRRALIDSITPETPVLVNRWDRTESLANRAALERAGASCAWEGVECENGVATGRLTAEAAARVRRAMPPKSLEQRLAESRAALADLASHGVTTIHDNTGAAQMRVYQALKERGELTVRVYARPTLDRWDELAAVGIRHGFGDEWIRIGGLKGFVDGIMGNSSARFYEPQLHSGERGSWRTMMTEPPGMLPLLIGADSSGHWPQVHAIGDEAIDTLLAMFEEVMRVNGPRERRFRLIHTQVLRDASVADRMARLGIIAEVQPFHAIDDMRWMEERIGERSRWAYAFRTLRDAGVTLSFGSDWPGTNAAWYPADPVLGIYAAVTRQTLDGAPEGGWFPEERIDVETALRAYTINNAWAADEDALKGSIATGKLADLVILDRSPFDVAPADIRDIGVLRTVLGGKTVFERSMEEPRR
ncbi:MAG: amidohydrolase [Gemmatimonadetes bacterium]|nr:amidohydrolase [Gemmatimonadota bacterium]